MQQAATATTARSRLPFSILSWLKGYDQSWLRFDVIAVLTTWALVVPQSIAYGQIAGLPPQAGLFTAFGSLLGYALLGTSRQLIVSPASATAAVSASLIAPLALGDAARYWSLSSLLAVIVGVTFVVYGPLKLGFVSQFIATSVQTGLMFGLGMTIIAGQLPKLLGIPTADGTFIQECLNIDVGSIDKLEQINRELKEDGVQLWIARPHGEAERMLYHSGLDRVIGADHIFHTVGEGVAAFRADS